MAFTAHRDFALPADPLTNAAMGKTGAAKVRARVEGRKGRTGSPIGSRRGHLDARSCARRQRRSTRPTGRHRIAGAGHETRPGPLTECPGCAGWCPRSRRGRFAPRRYRGTVLPLELPTEGQAGQRLQRASSGRRPPLLTQLPVEAPVRLQAVARSSGAAFSFSKMWQTLYGTVTRNHRRQAMRALLRDVRRFLEVCQP